MIKKLFTTQIEKTKYSLVNWTNFCMKSNKIQAAEEEEEDEADVSEIMQMVHFLPSNCWIKQPFRFYRKIINVKFR